MSTSRSSCRDVAQPMLQCSRTQSMRGGRSSLNYLIQSFLWHNNSAQQSSIYNPLISFPHNSTTKLFWKPTASRATNLLFSGQKCSLKPPVTQVSGSGVSRDSFGKALQGRQVGSSNEPTACTPPASRPWCCCWPPHDHVKSITSCLWGQRDKQ